MKQELQDKLYEAFPLLYYKEPHYSPYISGFDIDDGWYDIIWELSEKINPLVEKNNLAVEKDNYFQVIQIKEKFAGLRYYISGTIEEVFDEIHKYIGEAESKSFSTCERCGKPGTLRTGGWMLTLCDECDRKRNEKKES